MNEGGSDYADDGYLVKLICTVSGYRDHYDGAYDYLVRRRSISCISCGSTGTGAELLIGQKALVIEEIDTLSSKGRVEVRGQEWAAKTDAPEGKIPKNAIVVVEGIQGVKLIVRNGEETKI